jgi:hypothetical protein
MKLKVKQLKHLIKESLLGDDDQWEDAYQIYSDTYKSVYGVRPHLSKDDVTIEQLIGMTDDLYAEEI